MPAKPVVRINHYLRHNHDSTVPQCVCVVHTVPIEIKASATSGRSYRQLAYGAATFFRWMDGKPQRWEDLYFNTPEQFWSWLVAKYTNGRSMWLFSHRLGEALTLLDFWTLLDTKFYQLEEKTNRTPAKTSTIPTKTPTPDYLLCTRDPPTIVLARHERHFLHALDVRNYFPETLEELGKLVELDRLPQPGRKAPEHHWEQYAMRDVEIVRRTLARLFAWWEKDRMGVFRYTAASLAFAHYRHRHLKEPILIDDCEPARVLSREALVGGECRVFYCGKVADEMTYAGKMSGKKKGVKLRLRCGPIYVLDVNSLYPAVMRLNLFPRKLAAYKAVGSWEDIHAWSKTLCLAARVRLNTPEQAFPCMVDKERWWAVGDFWTSLAGPELLSAYNRGLVRQVGAIAAYLPGRLFTSFVDAIYPQKVAARKAGRLAEDRFMKMILNALPGKMGQRQGGWEWSDMPSPGPKWGTFCRAVDGTPDPKLYRLISGYVQQEQDQIDALDSLPVIEAYVNSYARLFMASIRADLPAGSIFYQDTDSLHLTQDGYDWMQWHDKIDDERLGYFHLERIAQYGEYRGPKDYSLDGENIIAGKKAQPLHEGARHFIQEEVESLDTILNSKPAGVVQVDVVKKRFGRSHPRGILWADGTVTPAKIVASQIHLLPT